MQTRTALRCRDGAALLFFEPRLEVAGFPAGGRVRFYVGGKLMQDTLAGETGTLVFSASVSSRQIPALSLAFGRDSLAWDPADSMAAEDGISAPLQLEFWVEKQVEKRVEEGKDSGRQNLALVTPYSLLASETGRRIACGADADGMETLLDEYVSYNAVRFRVKAQAVSVGHAYAFAAYTGESFVPDSVVAERAFRFPEPQAGSARLRWSEIGFEGDLPHLPATLQVTLGGRPWRYHLSQE